MTARPNIVLVHGAWADGSCWSGVIERLQADGYHVTAPQFPMTALADDVARLRQVLNLQDGPTIVAAHSYGGQIMTALGQDAPNVTGLVYVAAFGLDAGNRSAPCCLRGPRPGARASVHRRAGIRLAARGRLRQVFRGRRAPGPGQGDARRAAALAGSHLRRRDGHSGLEVAAVLVPGRHARPGDPAGRRAHVRLPDGRDHDRGSLQPRGHGLPPGRSCRPHQGGSREPRRVAGRRFYPARRRASAVPSCMANGLPAREAAVLAAAQRPLTSIALTQKSGVPRGRRSRPGP